MSSSASTQTHVHWLLNPSIGSSARIGLHVQVNGTRGGWYQGEREGCRGTVCGIQLANLSTATATVKLAPNGETLSIPVQYLSPVPPNEAGQNVIVLDDSKLEGSVELKGVAVSVVAEGEVEGSWIVTQDGAEFYEIEAEHLVVKNG
ncbi:uncharacterized protein STEHIDRAFT_168037 [Stereum hirsutum FP-91666 SS1]|uniref:uncharacterized protein n=1 Tax=Stereum hirsutum (strain FP-91666) TaxID=721885 RepID=UPI000440E196|nr:uncharacterized protein STEHIDRAFT_168037 [Stereum hirsutum FP-91666 SS1]EIM87218.1 hypothetical protein STEHIDRAFT_168037 [Stereum hirsutum FP-91666 SS1]